MHNQQNAIRKMKCVKCHMKNSNIEILINFAVHIFIAVANLFYTGYNIKRKAR